MSYTPDAMERFGRYTRPETVGDVLRRAREHYGLDLESVSESLKIRLHYLQAIEDSRLDDLPGTAYALGFVRTYADYLGLDSIELIRRFRDEARGAVPDAELLVPNPQRERRFSGGAVLILSLVLAAVAYGGWYAMSERDKVAVEAVPQVPPEMLAQDEATTARAQGAAVAVAATVDEAAADAAAVDGPSPGTTASPPPAAAEGATGPSPGPAETPAAAAAQVAAVAPPPAPPVPEPVAQSTGFVPQGEVYGADNKGARIVILARLESWVRVSDANQKPIWTRVLREGEAYQVPNDPGLTLTTGNAGGLEIYIDGKPIPAIGGVGMVSRNVPLDPAAMSGAAPAQ
jgi:cytoskeleton protein RodZ